MTMPARAEYIEIVRNLYSLGAAAVQDDRDGFVLLAEDVEDLTHYAIAGIVAMRAPVITVSRRDQVPVRSLLSEHGPLASVPTVLRDALGRLHRGQDFDTAVILEHLRRTVRVDSDSAIDENILVLGAIVDAVVAAWALQVGDGDVVSHARRLLLVTGMIET